MSVVYADISMIRNREMMKGESRRERHLKHFPMTGPVPFVAPGSVSFRPNKDRCGNAKTLGMAVYTGRG